MARIFHSPAEFFFPVRIDHSGPSCLTAACVRAIIKVVEIALERVAFQAMLGKGADAKINPAGKSRVV
jgi:hypothetical protein